MCSPPSGANAGSLQLIRESLSSCAEKLGARPGHTDWSGHFYQNANRLAQLQFLHENNVKAYLAFVNFLNDAEMEGPTTTEAWEAAYKVAFRVLGLGNRHRLSRYVIHVHPDVSRSRNWK